MREFLNNYKKIIVLVISVVVAFGIFCISVVNAYADDEEVQLTQEQIDFINNSNDIEDAQIRALATNLAATSTYSVDDIYNLLVSVRRAVGTQYAFATTNASLEATVNAIQQELLALGNPNSPTSGTILDMLSTIVLNTGGNNAFTMANSVNAILEAIGYDFASGTQPTNTLYDTLVYCEQMLASGLFDSNATPYLSLINGNITALGTSASYIYNALRYTEPNGDINTAGKYLYDIAYYISPICEMLELSIEPNVEVIKNKTTHIDNDIHNMYELFNDVFYKKTYIEEYLYINQYVSNDSGNRANYPVLSGTVGNTSIEGIGVNKLYPIIPIDSYYTSGYRVYFDILEPYFIRNYNNVSPISQPHLSLGKVICFNENMGTVYNKYATGNWKDLEGVIGIDGDRVYIDYDTIRNNITNTDIPNTAKYIVITFGGSTTDASRVPGIVCSGRSQSFSVTPYSLDVTDETVKYTELYHQLLTHIDDDMHYQNDILDLFKELYASDDLIAAKEAQQPLEDQVLEDFTGNGSASVTTSDATDAKGISNALKNGLSTGASSGNALEVFDSASAFWGWFSQDNANYFVVTVPSNASPQPLLRSAPSEPDYSNYVWTDSVPDVLSSIDIETQDKINSDIGGEHR